MLQAINLECVRGQRRIFSGLSFDVQDGELFWVAGQNGSGKTSLLRIVCTLLRAEAGTVRWDGTDVRVLGDAFLADLVYIGHAPAVKDDLTALENLRFSVGLKRRSKPQELRGALERTGVAACADLPARVLSAGQRRRVSLARVIAMQAPLWLLDEPYANLDAAGSELVSGLLQDHVAAGGLALVVAHRELALACNVRRLELNS
jgi:heme exporter protein A